MKTTAVTALDQEFLTEDVRDAVREERADALGILRVSALDGDFATEDVREDVRQAVRAEVAELYGILRAQESGLAKLAESLITWTIGTGIAVAAVVIVAIKWL